MNYKKIVVIFLTEVLLVLGIAGLLVYYVDPFFHYRKPNPHLFYPLNGGLERYINDGILRQFEYDSIITGTSMTENFKVSTCNDLYASNTIKVPFSGATYKEINDNLAKAYKTENEIKFVIRSLDLTHLVENKNKLSSSSLTLMLEIIYSFSSMASFRFMHFSSFSEMQNKYS